MARKEANITIAQQVTLNKDFMAVPNLSRTSHSTLTNR